MFSSFKKIIEVIGVILVNKILQVSDGQFYNTSSVPCILCSPPQVSLCPSPFHPPFPSPTSSHPFPLAVATLILRSMSFVCLFSFSAQSLSPHTMAPPPAAVSLFSVSMSLFLFCLLVYFVYQIPNISEIIWYLSFCDWLITLSIMLSRSIHDVAKGKIFFLWLSSIPLYKCTTGFYSLTY